MKSEILSCLEFPYLSAISGDNGAKEERNYKNVGLNRCVFDGDDGGGVAEKGIVAPL